MLSASTIGRMEVGAKWVLLTFESSNLNFRYASPPEICTPPSVLFGGDAQASLDGPTTEAAYTGLPTSTCDFVKLKVDANPDRAHNVFVDIVAPRPQDIDVDSIQIYVWRTAGGLSGWVRSQYNPYVPWTDRVRVLASLGAENEYTEVIVAARAVLDDGSPVTSIDLKVQE